MRPLVRGDEIAAGGDWGAPALDPSVVAVPTSPAAAATTQATQAANEAQRVALAASQLSPPPFGVPFVGPGGFVSQSWVPWLTRLYQRSGNTSITPAADMELLLQLGDIATCGRPQESDWPEVSQLLMPSALDWPEMPQGPTPAYLRQQYEDLAVLMALGVREHQNPAPQVGTWTPTASGLGGTGIAFNTRYSKVGADRFEFTVQITGTGLTATGNSTYITLPFTPSKASACPTTNTSVANYGPSLVYPDGRLYLPTIPSTNTIVISGTAFL